MKYTLLRFQMWELKIDNVNFYHFFFLWNFQKPDEEDHEILNHEEDFSLPQSYFDKEE